MWRRCGRGQADEGRDSKTVVKISSSVRIHFDGELEKKYQIVFDIAGKYMILVMSFRRHFIFTFSILMACILAQLVRGQLVRPG